MQEPSSLDGSTLLLELRSLDRLTWPAEPIRLEWLTWMPEQTSLDELTRLSKPRSLDGLTWLSEQTSLDRLTRLSVLKVWTGRLMPELSSKMVQLRCQNREV